MRACAVNSASPVRVGFAHFDEMAPADEMTQLLLRLSFFAELDDANGIDDAIHWWYGQPALCH
jgi:hypothetical protein